MTVRAVVSSDVKPPMRIEIEDNCILLTDGCEIVAFEQFQNETHIIVKHSSARGSADVRACAEFDRR